MKKIFIIAAILTGPFVKAQTTKPGTHQESRAEKLNELYCSGLFKTTEGTILDVAGDPSVAGYLNILDWLQGRVAGLQVYTTWTGTRIPLIRGGVAAVFIDEIAANSAALNSLPIKDIAIVKVIKTPFYGGFNGANGAIAIYTINEEEDE